ncbi:MAG TPA: cytochrome c [Candidatus Acidoferrum sp.]|nr:cytochrome c [Candidatus Acidoferrum sp.]
MTRRSLKPLALLASSLALVAGAATFLACATPPKAGAAAGKAPAATAKADTAAGKASAGAAKGDAVAGKKIFSVKCIACHKPDGTGGIKLTGNPTPNWKDPKVWNDPKRATDAYFRDCITNGKAPSGMVAWGKTGQIKPPDIENLIAYIRTLGAPKKK